MQNTKIKHKMSSVRTAHICVCTTTTVHNFAIT